MSIALILYIKLVCLLPLVRNQGPLPVSSFGLQLDDDMHCVNCALALPFVSLTHVIFMELWLTQKPLTSHEWTRFGVAAFADNRKRSKYSFLEHSHIFIPVTIETSGVCGPQSHSFLADLGRSFVCATVDRNASQYLWQQLSIAIKRGKEHNFNFGVHATEGIPVIS